MTSTYRIIWAVSAENDLQGIMEYTAADSPGRTSETITTIRRSVLTLETEPEKGRVVPELYSEGITQYRELCIPPWRIIYRTTDHKVYILSVLDARRNIEDMLLARFVHLK